MGVHDVHIEILYCGICHSDIHTARNEWKGSVYPVIPGHEIVGRIKAVGSAVKLVRPGELAAVGCLVDSCRKCPECKEHLESYCDRATWTYNSPDPHIGKTTYGGYSQQIVVDEKYVLRIPKKFKEEQLASVAPLLCAGITTYSPMKHWRVGKGSTVGIVGLGGLGHVALKIARALGAHVVLFTSSSSKIKDGLALGAHEVILSSKETEMKKNVNRFDFILDTVSVPHQLDDYLQLLRQDGTLCLVGVPENPHPSPNVWKFIEKRRALAGSLVGGIKETQEMLDFCADHGVVADVEVIPIQQVNEAYERMIKKDVKYRFVIDLASL